MPPPGCHVHGWQPVGHKRMFRTHNGILALTYVVGAVGFTYYDMLIRANPNLESVVKYGATWPLRVFSMY
jgi:hypothetical protein